MSKFVAIKGNHVTVHDDLASAQQDLAELCGKTLHFDLFPFDDVHVWTSGTPHVNGVEFDPAINYIIEVSHE